MASSSALQEWVEKCGGPDHVAVKLGTTSHAVRYWVARKGNPKVDTIVRLINLSKGQLTFESIYASTHPTPVKLGASK